MHKTATDCAKEVGQGKAKQDIVEVYDEAAGSYGKSADLPEPNKGERKGHISPFKLGGNPY